MKKDSVIWIGAGQIGLAIAIVRRIASGKKIIIGDKNIVNAQAAAEVLNNTGSKYLIIK